MVSNNSANRRRSPDLGDFQCFDHTFDHLLTCSETLKKPSRPDPTLVWRNIWETFIMDRMYIWRSNISWYVILLMEETVKELMWRTSTGCAEFISLTVRNTAVMSFRVSLCRWSLVKPAVPCPVKVRSLLFLLQCWWEHATCVMKHADMYFHIATPAKPTKKCIDTMTISMLRPTFTWLRPLQSGLYVSSYAACIKASCIQ